MSTADLNEIRPATVNDVKMLYQCADVVPCGRIDEWPVLLVAYPTVVTLCSALTLMSVSLSLYPLA